MVKPAAPPIDLDRTTAFIVLGGAGSGKSAVAKTIARHLKAVYLDKDSVAGPLVELLLRERGDDPWERDENAFYQNTIFDVEYDTVLSVAADNLRLGQSVVIDAPFRKYLHDPDYFERARSRNEWPNVRVVVVMVTVSPAVHRQRLLSRANDRDTWKLAHWDDFLAELAGASGRWLGVEHVELDNTEADIDLAPLWKRVSTPSA